MSEVKSWEQLYEEFEPLEKEEKEEKGFLEETGENIEELSYGLEKSRWMLPNVVRTIAAGGDDELLKQREAERLAEIESRYDLSEERKESGFSTAGDVLGTLLDPTALALGGVGIAAKTGQTITAANRAVNALIGAGVSTADYAVYEKAAGEKADPIALAVSGVAGGVFGSLYSKTKKTSTVAESPISDTVVTGSKVKQIEELTPEPIAPLPNIKDDEYIDKLTASFNAENPSRIKALKDTQINGRKLGEAVKIQRLYNLETARRDSKKKNNFFTDEKYEQLGKLNDEAYKYIKNSSGMLARQAEVIGEGISGVAGRLKEEGTLNANMIRRLVYRPTIGAVGGIGLGYSVSWASDEDLSSNDLMYYALAGAIGGAASKSLMKSNKLDAQDVDMAKGEIDKILKANSLGVFDYITAGSAASKANAFGGKVATVGKTLFAQRGVDLRGAASTSVEENKDLALQELNSSWSRVLSDSNATKKGGLVNLFSADAKGLREAAYEYSEGFVDTAKLTEKGFSPSEVTTIMNLAKEATSRVGVLTEEVAATGIRMRGKVKDYKLPQFHDINKIVKNEMAARQAYKKAYRIQRKAETSEEVATADEYIDFWIDDMISGGSATKHTSAWVSGKGNQGTVLRPLTDHFEKPRMFKDFDARLEIKDFLVKDIDQVYRQYVDNTVPIMEFSRKFGAKGEALIAIKREINQDFQASLSRASSKQRKKLNKAKDSQIEALDNMVNDYFGFVGAGSTLARSTNAQAAASVFVTGANVARLGKVTITSLADLVQPLQNSGIAASLKGLARQKDFAKETGFAQRDVLGDELRQYALEVSNPGSRIQRGSRAVNELFFKGIGLTKLTSYARKFAYNTGVERGFTVANKIAKGRSGTAVRNEANSLGISDEYAKTLAKFNSVEEAFEDVDGNRILNIIGVKSADRDALIPQIGNRRAFSKSKDPLIRGLGQFLSWAQAKTTQTNSLITRMEDGHDILFVRALGAIAVINGVETFKSWLADPTGADLDINQDSYADQYATLENFGKAAGRTGNFNNYLIDKVANLAASGERFELDDISPSLDWMVDVIRATIGAADDIAYGDVEGAIVQGSKVLPLGREIKAGVEAVTGERYVDVPNIQGEPYKRPLAKGGEVLDVPNTSKEPDERIDKMTGMPYNQQAGTAFTDVEDREDPLQRMGFGIGSLVGRFAGKALKSVDDDIVEEVPLKTTDEIIEESKQISKALEEGEIDSAIKANSASKTTKNKEMSGKEYEERWSSFEDIEDVNAWQEAVKKHVKENRDVDPVVRTPELEQSAKDLIDKKTIDRSQHLKNVQRYKPITTWESIPREPSTKSLIYSLKPDQMEKGNFVVADIEAQRFNVAKSFLSIGDFFNGRLDIPAYKVFDTWIVAGTSKNHKGTGTHYAKAVHYTGKDGEPVKFLASQKTGERIGKGEKGKTGYATVSGWVKSLDATAIRKYADSFINDSEWTQVGFDPRRQGSFYIRSGENIGAAVTEATEVIQIGPLVLAKNVKVNKNYKGFSKGGKVLSSLQRNVK